MPIKKLDKTKCRFIIGEIEKTSDKSILIDVKNIVHRHNKLALKQYSNNYVFKLEDVSENCINEIYNFLLNNIQYESPKCL